MAASSPSPGPQPLHPPSIELTNLTYRFTPQTGSGPGAEVAAAAAVHEPGLFDITLSLPPRSRTILVGANGSGKTTLLRLLAGQRMPSGTGMISVSGTDPFGHTAPGVTYLGMEWVLNPTVRQMNIPVSELLASVGGDVYHERRGELVRILDIDDGGVSAVAAAAAAAAAAEGQAGDSPDPNSRATIKPRRNKQNKGWRMNAISDGERRRVQLAMGLIRPWRVLLLDEITVDLDLLTRLRFLTWLRAETERRECTIVYATHIFDNLAEWPTHLVHMVSGRVKEWGLLAELLADGEKQDEEKEEKEEGEKGIDIPIAKVKAASSLNQLVLTWLAEDLRARGPRNVNHLPTEAMSYPNLEGRGGYGYEPRPPPGV